jgi:hypothetical protein
LSHSGDNFRNSSDPFKNLFPLRHLKKLSFSVTQFTPGLQKWLSSCHQLHELHLTPKKREEFLSKTDASSLSNLKELRKLAFPAASGQHNEDGFDPDYYKFLATLPHLKVLKISDTSVSTPELVTHILTQTPNLKTFEFKGNPNQKGMKSLELITDHLKQMKKLKNVTIGHCHFKEDFLLNLFKEMPRLNKFSTPFPLASLSEYSFCRKKENDALIGYVKVANSRSAKFKFDKLKTEYPQIPLIKL